MRNRVVKVLTIMIIMLMMIASINKVFAGNMSFSTSGGKFGTGGTEDLTVTVKFPDDVANAQAKVTVTFADGHTESKNVIVVSLGDSRKSVKFTPTAAGNAMVKVHEAIDGSNNSLGEASAAVTIANSTPAPQPNNTVANNTTTNTTTNTTNTAANNTVKPEVKNPEFKTVNEKVYAVSNCNVRSSCSTEVNDNKIGGLSKGQEVTRTGTSAKWSRIEYNGKTAYVYNTLLTTEKPEEPEENEVENEVVEDDGFKNELDLLKDDIGVLPEVGTNIATVSFVGIAIISLAVVLIVRFRITKNEIDD